MGEHSKAAILKYTRKYCGISQEELAANICDVATLARYESGKIEPSDGKFDLLMRKMGMSGERYALQLSDSVVENKKKKIFYAFERKDFKEARIELESLKLDLAFDEMTPENRQYVQRIELNIAFQMGEINSEEMLVQLISALKITFVEYNEKHFHVYRIFTETEVLLINNIASQYWNLGKYELAVHLHENMEEYYQSGVVTNDYKPRYLCLVNYSNYLGRLGRYDESIEICKRGIRWLHLKGKVNFLYNFYYNIGWNIEKKIKDGLEGEHMVRVAQCYVWVAMLLGDMYPESDKELEHTREYYQKLLSFNKVIK